MGMHGYKGSAAEREDRKAGLKEGGCCVWLAQREPVGLITSIDLDQDGNPVFTLVFDERTDHKLVEARREEIRPLRPTP